MRDLINIVESELNFTPYCDENGKPMVFYHGTHKSFDDHEFTTTGENGSALGKGLYFTADPKYADAYTLDDFVPLVKGELRKKRERKEGANIRPVYLSMKNPFFVRENWDKLQIYHEKTGGGISAYAKEHGYDGIVYHTNTLYYEVCVFSPDQVKSIFREELMENANIDFRALATRLMDDLDSGGIDTVKCYIRMDQGLDPYSDEEIDNFEDLLHDWCEVALTTAYENLSYFLRKGGGTMDVWREITAPENWKPNGRHPGECWSWQKEAAEAHWATGDSTHIKWLIHGRIKEAAIDWPITLIQNANPDYADEKEIRIFKNAPVEIVEYGPARGHQAKPPKGLSNGY